MWGIRAITCTVAGMILFAGCTPQLPKTGKWQLLHGETADTLILHFSTYRHPVSTRKPSESGKWLQIRIPLSDSTTHFHLPCGGCRAVYEEGPMLLTFASQLCTGEVITHEMKEGQSLKGRLGLRFVMPDPAMEATKVSEWLDWEFKAKWQPNSLK